MRSLDFAVVLPLSAVLLVACHSTMPGDLCSDGGTCGSSLTCYHGSDFPSGVCSQTCDVGVSSSCPSSSQCSTLTSGNYCLATCDQDTDCQSGASCATLNGNKKVCQRKPVDVAAATPTCSAPVQVYGNVAGPGTAPTSCQQPVVTPVLPANVTSTHLGVHTTGDVVSFNVPENTVGVSIVSQAVTSVESVSFQGTPIDNSVVPTKVTTPDGGIFYDDLPASPVDLSTANAVYLSLAAGIGAFTFPNTSTLLGPTLDHGLPSGSWQATVNDYAAECDQVSGCTGGNHADSYDMTVITRPGPALTQGTVDVAMYWVTTGTIKGSTAMNDAHVQRLLSSLATLYSHVGLCLGTVTHYDLPAWAITKYASIGVDNTLPCSDLDQLFTLSQPGNRLNFFLVDEITAAELTAGAHVAGLDGTIPGPSGFAGTVKSGAVVSLEDISAGNCTGTAIAPTVCGADATAYITAHEGGHGLGLYHTSESGGEEFDPLVDTPTCRCETCANSTQTSGCGGDTLAVVGVNCTKGTQACGGGDNLMFWLLDSTSKGNLTPEQGDVMRLSLSVH